VACRSVCGELNGGRTFLTELAVCVAQLLAIPAISVLCWRLVLPPRRDVCDGTFIDMKTLFHCQSFVKQLIITIA
jgi:hypothetical protein